jgi:hypothetical protein
MKPIKPIYIRRNNNQEKVALLVIFMVVISILVFSVTAVKAQTANNNYKAGVSYAVDKGATISWNMAADCKYPFIVVERSQDKVHYETVYATKNKGNCNSTNFYTATDYNPLNRTCFYRITELDSRGNAIHLFQVVFPGVTTQLTQK